jgi:hypothetical protein
MPLIPPVLQLQLKQSFANAMREFIKISKQGGNVDSQDIAIEAASLKFGLEASTAIDAYIRTATIQTASTPPVVQPFILA